MITPQIIRLDNCYHVVFMTCNETDNQDKPHITGKAMCKLINKIHINFCLQHIVGGDGFVTLLMLLGGEHEFKLECPSGITFQYSTLNIYIICENCTYMHTLWETHMLFIFRLIFYTLCFNYKAIQSMRQHFMLLLMVLFLSGRKIWMRYVRVHKFII